MKINFRQGLQKSPLVSGVPSFLVYNTGTNTITIAIGADLLRATAAHKTLNYLIEEREDSVDAWGPLIWNPLWGTAPSPFTFYLYWNISLASGEITRGFTPRAPVYSASAPLTPLIDQHWFDKLNNVMKVWDGSIWRTVIRVFAGSFNGGTQVITENLLGSHAGITFLGNENTWPDHGYILYGIDLKGIRNGVDASFVTTSTPLLTNHGSFSSPIRLELSNSTSLASEPIPAFYAITSNGDGTIGLASGSNVLKKPIGIVTVPAITGDPIDIVFKGIVYNDQWNWSESQGRDLFCGPTGQLYQDLSAPTNVIKVGVVLSPKTILVDIDLYGSTTGGGGGIEWPLRAPTLHNDPGVVPFSFMSSITTGMQLKLENKSSPEFVFFRDEFTDTTLTTLDTIARNPDVIELYQGAYAGVGNFTGITELGNLVIPIEGSNNGIEFQFDPVVVDTPSAKYIEFSFAYALNGDGGLGIEFSFGLSDYIQLNFSIDGSSNEELSIGYTGGSNDTITGQSFTNSIIRYEFGDGLQRLLIDSVEVFTSSYNLSNVLGTPSLYIFDNTSSTPQEQQSVLINFIEIGSLQSTVVKPALEFKRESDVGLRLTTILQDDTVVETDVEDVRGFRITSSGDPVVRTVSEETEDEFEGLLRGINKGNQYKLELHAGASARATSTNGAVGYHAVTPYQHHIWEDDIRAKIFKDTGNTVGFSGIDPELDFSIGRSIVYHMNTIDPKQTRLKPIKGFAGESYEILLRTAKYSPGIGAFYRYPQHSTSKGLVGPIGLIGLEGVNAVATIEITPNEATPFDYFALKSGRPKQIVVSNIGYSSGIPQTPGSSGYQLPANYDYAFILTTGNRLETFGSNDYGTRLYGTFVSVGAGSTYAEPFVFTAPTYQNVGQDGEMWYNNTSNRLYVYSTLGDLWSVRTFSTPFTPPQNEAHVAIPDVRKVYAISGSELQNSVFVLKTNTAGNLQIAVYNNSLSTQLAVTTLVTAANFAGSCNEFVVDEANSTVYITLPQVATNNLRIIAYNYSTFTILDQRIIPFTNPHNSLPDKAYPVLRAGALYVPALIETLKIQVGTWTYGTLPVFVSFTTSFPVDRYTLFQRNNFLIGTCGQNLYDLFNEITGGVDIGFIALDPVDIIYYTNNSAGTFALNPILPWVTDTVSSIGDLPSTVDQGAIFTVTSNGVSYVSDGTLWEPVNEGVLLSSPRPDNLVDEVLTFTGFATTKTVSFTHPGEPMVPFNSNYNIRYSDPLAIMGSIGGGGTFANVDRYLLKLSKIELSNSKFQDQNNVWYVDSVVRFTY